jgi:hypothetical protein
MKRLISFVFALLILIPSFAFAGVCAQGAVTVFVDGTMVEFDVAPQIINDRTMVPMRKIFETLGATVNWEEICQYGNDNLGFVCGLMELGELEAGTTITVELRIYETTGDPTTEDGPKNIETGEYITVGTFTFTFE